MINYLLKLIKPPLKLIRVPGIFQFTKKNYAGIQGTDGNYKLIKVGEVSREIDDFGLVNVIIDVIGGTAIKDVDFAYNVYQGGKFFPRTLTAQPDKNNNLVLIVPILQNSKPDITKTIVFSITKVLNRSGWPPSIGAQSTCTYTILNSVLPTFSSTSFINIPEVGQANPYPTQINVSGLIGTIKNVTVNLNGLTHHLPSDLAMLLVGPQGQYVQIFGGGGGSSPCDNIYLSLDSKNGSNLIQGDPLVSGTFKSFNFYPTLYKFSTPAPQPSKNQFGVVVGNYLSDLSVFNGTNPNGVWQLYIQDENTLDAGSIAGGWSLTFDVA